VSTETGGMNSKVVENIDGKVRFPLQEPMAAHKGQIAEYVRRNGGAGVQHVALLTDDIVAAVNTLRQVDIEFVDAPRGYYEALKRRFDERELRDLRNSHILADSDDYGYLLQIFTKPLTPRRTLFIELIERRNARGFGSANIKALFRAVEQEQA
jgi:4-hydroxyphenylpyruvate dioxygenase